MINNDVQLWFAKDSDGKIVTIDEVDKTKEDTYYCPICGSEVNSRQGKIQSWCFAHIDKSKCNNESIYHFWYKNKLLQQGDKFIVRADSDKEYICKEVLVEQTYKIGDKVYKPDLTIVCEDNSIVYFEFDYTNKKKLQDYIDLWIELGNTVVEIDVKTLLNYKKDKLPIFKALWYEGKCFNVKKGENEIYYDTIGKYKESLIKTNKGKFNQNKEKLIKLDWFWEEIKNYKQEKSVIDDIIISIDNINEKELIYKILTKNKCNDIKDVYEEYKIKEFKEKVNSLLNDNFEKYNIDLVIGKNGVNKKIKLNYKEEKYFNEYLWQEYKFEYKDFDIKSVLNAINKEKTLQLQKEKWKDVRKLIKKILKKEYKDFTLSCKFDNINCKVNMYLENKYLIKEKILCIDYRTIKRLIPIYYGEESYNILLDNADEFLENELNRHINEIMKYYSNKINEWIDEKDFYNIFAEELIKVLKNSDKILNVSLNYMDKNIIYFEDIFKNKYIFYHTICNSNHYNNKIQFEDIENMSEYNHINMTYKNIYRLINEGFYLYFNANKIELHYKDTYCIRPNFEYKSNLFTNTIEFSFKNYTGFKRLDRYNFIQFNKELDRIIKNDVQHFLYDKQDEFIELNKDNTFVYNGNNFVNSKEIDEKIKKCLYPIYYAINEENNLGKIILNCDFTKDKTTGKHEPWLIKSFIENLEILGIDAENII